MAEQLVRKRGRPKSSNAVGATKHCCYGVCSSDSRVKYAKEGVTFISFVKPCLPYRKGEITNEAKHLCECESCKKCQHWVNLCKRDDKFKSLANVTKDTYICSLHFVDQTGPTIEHPDPLPATASTNFIKKTTHKRKLPTKRNVCKKSKHIDDTSNLVSEHENQIEVDTIQDANQTEDIMATRNLWISSDLLKIKEDIGDKWWLQLSSTGIDVCQHKGCCISLSVSVSTDYKCTINVFGVPINNEKILAIVSEFRNESDVNKFLKNINDNWQCCTGLTDNSLIEAHKKIYKTKKGLYCEASKSVRSVNCLQLIELSSTCTNCTKYKHKLVEKLKKTNEQQIHPCTNYRFYSRNNLEDALKSNRQILNQTTKQLHVMKEHIKKLMTSAHDVTLEDNNDMLCILQSAEDDHLPREDFAKIFLEEQIKLAKRKGVNGHKWHPTIIKYCLYLKSKDPKAYAFLRDSGCI